MKSVTFDENDLYVLVLLPALKYFGVAKPLEIEICGKNIENWIDDAVNAFPYRKIEVGASDDIISLVKKHQTGHKYTMIVYGDVPLLTRASIEGALGFAKMFNHNAVRLPRGWLFSNEYINTAEQIATIDCAHLDNEDFLAVYNWSQLERASKIMQRRINSRHMANGVRIVDSATTYIDHDVDIERGVVIEPGCLIKGKTLIKSGAKIGPNAHIRDGVTSIGKNCKIGNFVEIKNANIGDGTKISHLTYVGDATIGRDCNIGCGVVFCNYDGEKKHHTIIGNNVFVGSNVNLVAPVKVEDNAIIAAGSTITEDVCDGCLAIARERQVNKTEYVAKKKLVAKKISSDKIKKPKEVEIEDDLNELKKEIEELRAEIVTARAVVVLPPQNNQELQEEADIIVAEVNNEEELAEAEEEIITTHADAIELNESETEVEAEIEELEEELVDEEVEDEENLDEESEEYHEEENETVEIVEETKIEPESEEKNEECLETKIEDIIQEEQALQNESEEDDEDDDYDDDGILKVFKLDGQGQEIEEEELDDDSADDFDDNFEEIYEDETLPLLRGKFDWDNPEDDIEEFYMGRD